MNAIIIRCCLCDALQLNRKSHQCEDCGHTIREDESDQGAAFVQLLIAESEVMA